MYKLNILIKRLLVSLKEDKEIIINNVHKDSKIDRKYLSAEFEDSIYALKNIITLSKRLLKYNSVSLPNYNKKSFITYIPKGKVLQILPSTTPILSCLLIPFTACVSGNHVTVKPSSKSESIAKYLNDFFTKHNFSDIKFEIGSGKDFILKLILKCRYDFVFFMGSHQNGKELEEYCNKNQIDFLGEYEGNDWAIVFGGNVNKIAEKIKNNVLYKEGKDCDSIKGVLIQKNRYKKLKSSLFISLNGLKIKENPTPNDISDPPFYSSLWIKEFTSEEEILNLLNSNKQGLSISIFDKNLKRATKLARRINTARVIINSDTLDINPLIPWGGVKETSKGGADYWIYKFTNKKIIEINSLV